MTKAPMMINDEYITVAVCTCNRQDMIGPALRSLVCLHTTRGYSFEIIVVDDGSEDETAAIVEYEKTNSPIDIRYYRHDRNLGVAAARNTCIRHARGTWVAFFDDDEIADPDWLANLIATARRTGAVCVGGPCVPLLPDRSLPLSLRRTVGENPVMRKRVARFGCDSRRRRNAVPAAMGTGNILINRVVFEQIGLFNEELRRGEDLHFFLRAHESGAQFAIAPDAIIYHVVPPARLAPDYLVSAAARGGTVRADIEIEILGLGQALRNAVLRLARLLLWTAPSLLLYYLVRDRSRVLGTKCSVRYSVAYCGAVRERLRRPSAT